MAVYVSDFSLLNIPVIPFRSAMVRDVGRIVRDDRRVEVPSVDPRRELRRLALVSLAFPPLFDALYFPGPYACGLGSVWEDKCADFRFRLLVKSRPFFRSLTHA